MNIKTREPGKISRRDFLRLTGAAAAGLVVTGCMTQTEVTPLPYTDASKITKKLFETLMTTEGTKNTLGQFGEADFFENPALRYAKRLAQTQELDLASVSITLPTNAYNLSNLQYSFRTSEKAIALMQYQKDGQTNALVIIAPSDTAYYRAASDAKPQAHVITDRDIIPIIQSFGKIPPNLKFIYSTTSSTNDELHFATIWYDNIAQVGRKDNTALPEPTKDMQAAYEQIAPLITSIYPDAKVGLEVMYDREVSATYAGCYITIGNIYQLDKSGHASLKSDLPIRLLQEASKIARDAKEAGFVINMQDIKDAKEVLLGKQITIESQYPPLSQKLEPKPGIQLGFVLKDSFPYKGIVIEQLIQIEDNSTSQIYPVILRLEP